MFISSRAKIDKLKSFLIKILKEYNINEIHYNLLIINCNLTFKIN